MGKDSENGANKIKGQQDKISGGKITWTDKTGQTHSGFKGEGAAKPYSGEQDDVSALMKMGWSRAQASAIVANIRAESSGNAFAVGDSGLAYGLAQWHPDRQRNFQKWAGFEIRDPRSTHQKQLEFINYELRQGDYRGTGTNLSNMQDAANAAGYLTYNYEKPDKKIVAQQALARGNIASQVFQNGKINIPSAGASTTANHIANTTNAKSTNVTQNVGDIHIHTQATDAKGIAKDIPKALRYDPVGIQAAQGLR
jgi:hypothetical protein